MVFLTRWNKAKKWPQNSKENKTNVTQLSKSKSVVTKNSMSMELGNVNHKWDVFNQNIQECSHKFNEKKILILDIGHRLIMMNEYRVVGKIGYGGFSMVWLVINRKSKEFKAAKVFMYGHGLSKLEIKTLQQTSNHPNILHFYEMFWIKSSRYASVAIYEPLGKDLDMWMKAASKQSGLSVPFVKKVAKHILMALKTIHDLKIVHSDIKPQNIATCVSQQSLRRQLEKIVESGKSFSSLRMACIKNTEFHESEIRKCLKEELDGISKLGEKEPTDLIFKLIDFGNAMKQGIECKTGTWGFRPPEYFFGAPLLPSHDIWSLGATIVMLLTNKYLIRYGEPDEVKVICSFEIKVLRNMLGKFSWRHYKEFKAFKDPDGFKKKFFNKLPNGYEEIFTTKQYDSKKAKKQIKKVLQNRLKRLQMPENERKDLIDFLFHMLNALPSKRKSADKLLLHPWLNGVNIKYSPLPLNASDYEESIIEELQDLSCATAAAGSFEDDFDDCKTAICSIVSFDV